MMGNSCVGPWSQSSALIDEARVAFIYPGEAGDHGWSKAHDDGRIYLKEELNIDTTSESFVAPADVNATIDKLVADDWNVIFTVSSDYISGTQQAAVDHPDTYFLSCCGSVSAENLTSYFGRMYQPLFLAGATAAQMTCTKHLGVVASKPFPEFVRHINAITLGARLVDPQIVVDVRWLDSFFNPELEATLTNELIANGADVILTQTDTTTPVEIADKTKTMCTDDADPHEVFVYSVGYDNIDGCDHGSTCLTSAYWNWGPMYLERVQSLLDGTWDPNDTTWRPMTNDSDSVVGLAELSTLIPSGARTDIGILKQQTVDGSTQAPFIGPLTDNSGSVRIAEGEEMDDTALDRMCWYVEGVISSENGQNVPAVVPEACLGDF